MATRIAINGFGRIGRTAFKLALKLKDVEVVAINDLTDTATLAHLLRHDTAYRTFDADVSSDPRHLVVNGTKIPAYAEKDPAVLPWKRHRVDVVLECTGVFTTKERASTHLTAGAKRVIISAPAKGDAGVETVVLGVNDPSAMKGAVLSNASCTTNCIAPVMAVLTKEFGVLKAAMTTVHAYTADQNLQDGPHKDLRRARAAAQNIVPTSTGAAKTAGKTIPSLEGIFDGIAIRVPVITASLTDLTILVSKKTTVDEVNAAFVAASKDKQFQGVLGVTEEPLVSSDFIGDTHSAVVDLLLTKVIDGDLVKVFAWYDNKWAYAHRLVELAARL